MKDFNDFKVKDITLADFGRQEILLAQDEMLDAVKRKV